MSKFIILFLPIFSNHYVFSQIQIQNNDTVEHVVTKSFENVSDSNILHLFNILINYYNRTSENETTVFDNSSEKSSGNVMKIHLRTRRKYVEKATEPSTTTEKTISKLQWVSKPFREGLFDFKVKSEKNQNCNLQSHLYEMHLKNDTLWAVRMAESSQSEPVGLLGGTTYQMGNFEECIKTKAYGVRGQYCLANFKFSLSPEYQREYEALVPDNDFEGPNQEGSVWEALVRTKKDPARIDRQDIYWAICLPVMCSSEDLEFSLNQTLLSQFHERNLQLSISVDPIYCHTKDRLPFTTGFWITSTFMALLLLLNILSTLLDGYNCIQGKYTDKTGGWREYVGKFSLWRNTYNLGLYNKGSHVKIVDTIKVLLMLCVIYGHALLYILGSPHFNAASLEELLYRPGVHFGFVYTSLLDVFFALSGFLTFYYGYHPMKLDGGFHLVSSIIFRYLRLMPVFAIVMAYVAFVLPYTSDGPIWKARITLEAENCQKNWWLDLLLLNNFFKVNEQCAIISWYITTDMLLCTIASILIYVMVGRPKFGICLAVFMLLLSIVVTFLVTYINRYNGDMKFYMSVLTNLRLSMEFKELYAALYGRVGPYLVGFLTGYITIKLQKTKFKFSNKTLVIGSVLAIFIGEGSQYYGIVFYELGRPFYAVENALYACLHRVFIAGCFSWFLLTYITTGFGKLDSVINHRMFTVLGRLTYSVFLMNTLSFITLTASIRTPVFYSFKTIMFITFGNIVASYVLGYMFYLYAEAPIYGIFKLLRKSLKEVHSRKKLEKANAKLQLQ